MKTGGDVEKMSDNGSKPPNIDAKLSSVKTFAMFRVRVLGGVPASGVDASDAAFLRRWRGVWTPATEVFRFLKETRFTEPRDCCFFETARRIGCLFWRAPPPRVFAGVSTKVIIDRNLSRVSTVC